MQRLARQAKNETGLHPVGFANWWAFRRNKAAGVGTVPTILIRRLQEAHEGGPPYKLRGHLTWQSWIGKGIEFDCDQSHRQGRARSVARSTQSVECDGTGLTVPKASHQKTQDTDTRLSSVREHGVGNLIIRMRASTPP